MLLVAAFLLIEFRGVFDRGTAGRVAMVQGHFWVGIAILALLALGFLTPLFGWFAYEEIGGKFAEKAHEALANFMLAVVLVHLAGVFVGSLAHRENLVRAMVLGVKRAAPQEAIERPYTPMAVVLFVWVAIVVYWLLRQ